MSVDLRPARSTDAGTLGDLLVRFQTDTDWMPDLYSGAEYIAFAGAMIDNGWVTVAELDGRVEGFLARDGEEVLALYVSDRVNRRGIGRQLLADAKAHSPRLRLRVAQANDWAQRFYQRQGFVEDRRGDGSDTEDGLPDIIFIWPEPAVAAPVRPPARTAAAKPGAPGAAPVTAAGKEDDA